MHCSLDVIGCPDRRLTRASLELAAELADGDTEVTILLPRRSYGRAWKRILHDQTADRIVDVVSQVSHVNATIVPFLVAPGIEHETELLEEAVSYVHKPSTVRTGKRHLDPPVPGTTAVSEIEWRSRVRVAGRVKTLRVQPSGHAKSLECTLVDHSGHAVTLVFLGRRSIAGIGNDTLLMAEGTVGKHHNRLAMINPTYEILSANETATTH